VRRYLRLLACALTILTASTTTASSATYAYDATPLASVDANACARSEDGQSALDESPDRSAFPSVAARGASTSAAARSVATEEGLSLSGRMQTESAFGDKAIQNALKVPGEDGYFDVVGHGTPSDVSGMSPAELAAKVEGNPGWGGQNVRLLSCSTGCPSGSYAQDLANQLGVTVKAPTTDFLVSSRGGITFLDGGSWQWFRPGG